MSHVPAVAVALNSRAVIDLVQNIPDCDFEFSSCNLEECHLNLFSSSGKLLAVVTLRTDGTFVAHSFINPNQ